MTISSTENRAVFVRQALLFEWIPSTNDLAFSVLDFHNQIPMTGNRRERADTRTANADFLIN